MRKFLLAALFFCASIQAAPRPTIFDNGYVFGPVISMSERRGYLQASGTKEELPCNPLTSFGAMFGKRWLLNPRLRLQVSGDLAYGSVIDDTLPPWSAIGIPYAAGVEKHIVRGGLIGDLQFPMVFDEMAAIRLYLHAGAGLHVTWQSESETAINGQGEVVAADGYLDSNQTMLSASVHGGIGGEWRLSPQVGMAVSYSLRYGYPVHYQTFTDMYPFRGVPYSERFISHEVAVVLTW